jgi:hypothetical protein
LEKCHFLLKIDTLHPIYETVFTGLVSHKEQVYSLELSKFVYVAFKKIAVKDSNCPLYPSTSDTQVWKYNDMDE